jgi:hypothetical protein
MPRKLEQTSELFSSAHQPDPSQESKLPKVKLGEAVEQIFFLHHSHRVKYIIASILPSYPRPAPLRHDKQVRAGIPWGVEFQQISFSATHLRGCTADRLGLRSEREPVPQPGLSSFYLHTSQAYNLPFILFHIFFGVWNYRTSVRNPPVNLPKFTYYTNHIYTQTRWLPTTVCLSTKRTATTTHRSAEARMRR